MVFGEKCPVCNSEKTGDGEMHYTHDNPSKVVATWSCQNCNAIYSVIYVAQKMEIEKFVVGEDYWEELYEVIIDMKGK